MGLPMYREPEEVESKPTVAKDPTAAARSSIRRQRARRHSSSTRPQPPSPRSQSTSNRRLANVPTSWLALHEHHRRRLGVPGPRLPVDTYFTVYENTGDPAHAADIAHSEASQRYRLESGRPLLRDALSYEQPNERMQVGQDGGVTPAAARAERDNWLHQAILREARNHTEREETEHAYLATPPDTSSASPVRSPPTRVGHLSGFAALTPGFAPAHRLSNERDSMVGRAADPVRPMTPESRAAWLSDAARGLQLLMRIATDPNDYNFLERMESEVNRRRSMPTEVLTAGFLSAEEVYYDSFRDRLHTFAQQTDMPQSTIWSVVSTFLPDIGPQLAGLRPSQRAVRNQRRREIDGLGDRERSSSPDYEAWENLLLTIPPDERVPSAHSSFTSASASASANSSQTSNQTTIMTAPSSTNETNLSGTVDEDDYCPGNIEDTGDSERSRRRSGRARAPNSLPSPSVTTPDSEEERAYMAHRQIERVDNDPIPDSAPGPQRLTALGEYLGRGGSLADLANDAEDRNNDDDGLDAHIEHARSLNISASNLQRMENLSARMAEHRARHGDDRRLDTLQAHQRELIDLQAGLERLQEQLIAAREWEAEQVGNP